jgi:hypothetical protein
MKPVPLEVTMMKRIGELKAENAVLKSEVERLRASSFVTAVPCEQYDRVIRAGDAMAVAINLHDDVFDNHEKKLAQSNWNAAKNGWNEAKDLHPRD